MGNGQHVFVRSKLSVFDRAIIPIDRVAGEDMIYPDSHVIVTSKVNK